METYLTCKLPGKREVSDIEDIPRIPIIDDINLPDILIDKEDKYVKVYGRSYEKNLLILEGEILFNRARKLWKFFENMIINEKPIPPTVLLDIKEVINLLLYTTQNISNCKHFLSDNILKHSYEFVKLLKASVMNISRMRDNVTNKLTCNAITLKSDPICEYFHSHLYIKYLILRIENLCQQEDENVNIKNFMLDIMVWSNSIYLKDKNEFMNVEPFFCTCIKKVWLYIIHYLKKSSGRFWNIFNDVMCNSEDEFVLWMGYHISILYLYDDKGYLVGRSNDIEENHELITKHLQSFTSSSTITEKRILNVLKLIHPVLTDVWIQSPKLEPYQILWEYFYKNLDNTSFGDIKLPKSLKEMMNIVERLKNNPKSLENPYEYYLYMLSNYLKKNPSHWNKMRGRIYSRLPPQKMNNFSNKAIFQISLLFIVLSQADITEAISKLYRLLEILTKDKQESELVWIIYLTLVTINVHQNRDIKNISTALQHQCEEIASNREKLHLLKHYISAMDIIMNSSENYDLGQNILLGSWITPYMNTCTYSDLCHLLDNITCMIVQVENCGKWDEFQHSFNEYVLPALKRISTSDTVPPQVGELVGKICTNSKEIIHSTMQYFCNPTVNIKVTHKFLVTILENNRYSNYSLSEEHLLVSSWFRISILSTDTSHNDLSVFIFNLSCIKSIIDIKDLENDSYTAFVKTLNMQMKLQMNISRLKELCELCFGNIDQWLHGFLTPYTADTQAIFLYTNISLFFCLCSPLLYYKSKSTCLFNRLISLLLLPTEILMGKPPPSNILKAIEKTWHLFIKGIDKLEHCSDPYVDRTLKDLVIRYIPHFPPTNSPILKILDEPKMASVVFDKISNAFLLKQARSSEENTYKALKTIQNILDNTNEESKIILILERILLGTLEVIMFSNQKVLALDLIKSLIAAGWYEQTQSKLQTTIQTLTDRHLAFSTSNYFQFIENIINIIPSSVRMSLPHIKKQISHLEKMRGVVFDNTLRLGLDRIEKALS